MTSMGPPLSDDEVDTLLAQGRLGGAAKDRVFEGALRDAGVTGAPRRARWRRLSLAAAASLAVGAAALIVVPRLSRDDGALRAKGAPGAALEFEVACDPAQGGALDACPAGG